MTSQSPPGQVSLPQRLAEAIAQHPDVAGLTAGPFGTVSTPMPGQRIVGVRAPEGEPVEVSVVLRLDRPLPESVAALRALVRSVAGPVPVDITISDVVADDPSHPPQS